MRRSLTVGEGSLSGLQSMFEEMTAEKDERFGQARETAEKSKSAEADIAQQLTLREAAREEVDTHMVGIAKL